MNMVELFNTLTRKKESFKPIKKGKVSIYTCGPTVYNYAHVGNFRTMLLYDFIKKIMILNNFEVTHVMNITDVDDKTIKGSVKENMTLKEFTRKYEKIFLDELASLNIMPPSKLTRATEYIDEMVKMIQTLMKKGYAYETKDGVYFSISKDKKYGKLARLEKSKDKKERIKADEYDKENAQDFALWKFHTPQDGEVFWDSPIGKGRPGWHIECSAMATSILGPTIDIHSGAVDLLFPHHTNEIAQSECCTGKKFVNYWVHGAFLNMGEKMSKSLGNVIYLKTLQEEGYSPIHFRYYCLLTQYRKPLLFSYENLDAAKNAFERIKNKIIDFKSKNVVGKYKSKEYLEKFMDALNDDLNTPLAVQVFIKVLDDDSFDSAKKFDLLVKMDEFLSLGIKTFKKEKVDAGKEILEMLKERNRLRAEKQWAEADILRQRIKEAGFKIVDTPEGSHLEKDSS